MTSFASLGVPARLCAVLSRAGIDTPTPIQTATLPDALAGRDVLGRGRTGSGKTYAFLLPLIARITGGPAVATPSPRALVLAPTRELANQIEQALAPLAATEKMTSLAVFGGVPIERQRNALRRGVDVLVACPGRLEDLVARGWCDLSKVKVTVIDEADHMADLGFLPAVRRLLTKTPRNGQRLLFSATLDKAVDVLAKQFLTNPAQHAVEPPAPVEGAEMTHHVLHIDRENRVPVLAELIGSSERTVVFTRTKYGAKALARQLGRRGIPVVELHGNLAQNARTRNLDAFHAGTASTLVATDIAARGIHVDDVALVVHADPPAEHKAYVHRSGRTARAGRGGAVVTMATGEQLSAVRDLTRAAGLKPTLTRIDAKAPADWAAALTGDGTSSATTTWTPASAPADDVEPRRGPSGGRGRAGGSGSSSQRSGRGRGNGGRSGGSGTKDRSGGSGAGDRTSGSAAPSRGRRRGRSDQPDRAGARSHSAASFSSGRR